jgi:hypothetical protein
MNKIAAYLVAGLGVAVAFTLLVVVIGLLLSYPTMWLWNDCLVGLVDGIHPIESVWRAWGMIILCGLLFSQAGSSFSKKSED